MTRRVIKVAGTHRGCFVLWIWQSWFRITIGMFSFMLFTGLENFAAAEEANVPSPAAASAAEAKPVEAVEAPKAQAEASTADTSQEVNPPSSSSQTTAAEVAPSDIKEPSNSIAPETAAPPETTASNESTVKNSDPNTVAKSEVPVATSESSQATPQDSTPPDENDSVRINKILKAKLRTKKGDQVKIILLKPLASEDLKDSELISIGIEKTLARLDGITLRRSDFLITKMNLEQLRRAVSKTHGDVLLVPSFKPTRWALTLYDKRAPYQVVMHSEMLPDSFIKNPTDIAKTNLVRNLVTQVFQQYATDQTYDLPREETAPMLQTDIPRWMASAGLMRSINSEINSRIYLSTSLGGVVTEGFESRASNSGVFALQAGYRPFNGMFSNLVVEVGAEFFHYNAFLAGVKYFFQSKMTTARFYLGLAGSYVTSRKTLITDASGNGLGNSSNYVVPSLAMVVPIGDILVKAEIQYFTSIDDRSNKIYSLINGILFPF